MTEEWRPCYWHPELFEVSNMGRVRKKTDGRVLKTDRPRKSDGYCCANLYYSVTETVMAPIHRLVAVAFLGDYRSTMQVHHKNGNRADNRLENLEWVDPAKHGSIDAKRRREAGIKTKYHENWLARKMKENEKLAPRVPE